MSRQPVETIDKAQHIRHEYVGDGEGPRQPLALIWINTLASGKHSVR
jgi:hypothetical protein